MMKPTDTLYIPIQFRDALALAGDGKCMTLYRTRKYSCGFILLGQQGGERDEARLRIAEQIKHAICIATSSEDMNEVATKVYLQARHSASAKKGAAKKKRAKR